jgi:hypothetical protein
MTDQLILGTAAVVVTLLIAYEVIETWRWRGYGNRPVSRFRVIRFFRRVIGGFFSIVTLGRWRHRNAEPEWTMSSDDVARRLGDAPPGPVHMQPGRIVVSGAAPVIRQPMEPVQAMQPVQPMREPRPPRPSRLRLARDTIGAALILGGFIVVFANVIPPGPEQEVEQATATPKPSPRVVGPATLAPVSPSPVSAATSSPDLGPTPTPTPVLASSTNPPTPKPTDRPTSAPQPGAQPTRTPAPTPKPKATKKPTPTPKPAATISNLTASPNPAAVGEDVVISFTYTNATTYTISFSDGAELTQPLAGSGTEVVPGHSFLDPGTFAVVVVVDGPGNPDSASVTVTVNGP